MDKNTPNSAVVPIRAHIASIGIVGNLEKSSSKRRDHFVIVFVDDEEIAKSEKKSGQPAPQWEWKDHQLQVQFHPSSTIKIAIYENKLFNKRVVGQYTGNVIELLNNDATIDLKDENGNKIASKIKIKLSLVLESEDTFESFMKIVAADISRLESTGLTSNESSALGALGKVLELTKNIMDVVADVHPIVKASWTVISATYKAIKQVEHLDDAVRDLAESLREMLGVAKEVPNLLVIKGTTNVSEEIGRTSVKIASLIHEYTRRSLTGRVVKSQLSGNLKTRTEQCQKICDDLRQKFRTRVIIDINRQLKTIKDDQLADKIYQWLSAPDSSKNYNEAREKYQKDTCFWFLDGERFRKFQEKADFLWIKGKAGSGKTILCSSIINKIITLREENPSTTHAYFFFDGRDSQKNLQLHDKLIRSLILQLSLQCDGVPDVLVKLYGGGYQQPSTDSLEDVLYHIINGMRLTYIIIDSLDECIEREKTLQWIKRTLTRKIGTLHMVVVSRPERDIEDVLQSIDPGCVDLAEESANRDITMYLEQQLSTLRKWDEETKNVVKSTLTERSEGMFRWVALQLIELKKSSNRDAVRQQLNSLPSGLDETYDQILLKVNKADRGDTKTFLRWLCYSTRPMSLSQIAEAVTVVDFEAKNGPQYTPSRRYWDERDVLEKCSGLIIESEGTIKLAHFSIKEYLLSDHLHTSASLSFHLTSAELSHSLISQTCLAYLLQFKAADSVHNDVDISFPLAGYAAEYWILHAKAGGVDESESSWTLTLATSLFAGAIFSNWVRIWDLDDPYTAMQYRGERYVTAAPLYYASLAGLRQICLHLVKEVDVNARGGAYGTALQAASSQGHEGIAKLLLENGADPSLQGGQYGNALQAASIQGHQAVVEALLENGADPNAQGGEYCNALYAASIQGFQAVVEMLLENGADANAQGGHYGNALQAASVRGYQAVVEVLLKKGADPNAQGGEYGNALYAASIRGHEAVVKVLLAKEADPDAQGGQYGNALQAASHSGHEAIVKVLLEKGVDANAQKGQYGNAVYAASIRGHETVVKVLLENGGNPNAQGGEYGDALQAASYWGHEAVVKVLLEKANTNMQKGKYSNALYAASIRGHEAVVKVLLEKGADPNASGEHGNVLLAASSQGQEDIAKLLQQESDASARGGKYCNALYVASIQGYQAVVEVLLAKGADPNALGGKYANALQAAASETREAIVKILLEKGANPNAQGGEYGNSLQVASLRGYEAIVKVLLENGADPNAQGGLYSNALQAALIQGRQAVVGALLEKGADPNAQGGVYGTALQAASYTGHKVNVEMLLEKGANPNVQGGKYGNALQAASYMGHEEIVKLLLEKGAEANAQGGEYGNALQAASYWGSAAMVEMLLKKGSDPNAQGGQYGSALQAAAAEGNGVIVKMLLEKGADPNAQGGEYGNALQAASCRGRKAIVEMLLENGADVNLQGGQYGNALNAASILGHKMVMKLLLEKGAHNVNSS